MKAAGAAAATAIGAEFNLALGDTAAEDAAADAAAAATRAAGGRTGDKKLILGCGTVAGQALRAEVS